MVSGDISLTLVVRVRAVQTAWHGQSEHWLAADGSLAGAVDLDHHLRWQQAKTETLLHALSA